MTINRRQFVQQSSQAALLLGAWGMSQPNPSIAADQASLPIIDTHQHLWDLTRFNLPWLEGVPEILNRSYMTQDYLKETAGLNVVKAVYMEVDVAPEQQLSEAKYVIDLSHSKTAPTVAAVISGRPASPAFRDYILQFKDERAVKGVRQVLHSPEAKPGLCLDKQFVASMQLLGSLGMSFDLCMRPSELSDGLKLVAACPDTIFVLDHLGNADYRAFLPGVAGEKPKHDADTWKKIAALAKRKNVICKISGIIAQMTTGWTADFLAPPINHCLEEFGPDRVVFGGDWPVCRLGATYREWVIALKQIIAPRSLADQKKLLHDNALKFYRLD